LEDLQEQGIEMHALSNYPLWFRVIEDRLRLSRFLAWSFVSCLTGVRKPSAEAYLGATRTLQRDPATCLFIDDTRANCQAAEAVGMPAIQFVDTTLLRSQLRDRGLLP
jgi:HAD superfamily hydrolase (TIGR01509 family)